MPEKPPPGPASSIQQAQRTRILVDALVQAGLSARIAYSLAGGLVGQARRRDDERLHALAQTALEQAERAKNADMGLDMAFQGGTITPDALREGAAALERAAEAFETAADVHERLLAIEGDGADA